MPAKTASLQMKPSVSGSTLELLLDLVEIKLGCVEVYDRDDARELRALHKARQELCGLLGRSAPDAGLPLAIGGPRNTRRPAAPLHA